MNCTRLKVDGAFVYDIDKHVDDRGYFQEVFSERKKYPLRVLQTNVSCSCKNVIRGLHVNNFPKLCTCIRGRLFDVVVDVRRYSPTYLQWDGVWLDADNNKQLYVPSNCAHGFFAAENETILLYSQGGTYNPRNEWAVRWNDPAFGVEWPEAEEYILSDKDKVAEFLNQEK